MNYDTVDHVLWPYKDEHKVVMILCESCGDEYPEWEKKCPNCKNK